MRAQEQKDSALNMMDSVTISLLTCQPGTEVYNLYGHTAIRYCDKTRGLDLAINYGMFSFDKPNFVLRFVFGLTDYEMGIERFDDFCAQYAYRKRGIIEQQLNLTAQEKFAISIAIDKNYLPENRVYRYNYFYDNCTTRARDILTDNIQGKVTYKDAKRGDVSYRSMTHLYNEQFPWARFGNDILLGVKADRNISAKQQQFLPDFLKEDFDNAEIENIDGTKRQLVAKTNTIVAPFTHDTDYGFPLRPIHCALILLAITIIISTLEIVFKCRLWLYDLLLLLLVGLSGIVLTAMIFSQHPTVNLNLQLLLLNPLPLLLAIPAFKAVKKQQCKWFVCLGIVLIILFYIGNIVQNYAEGMNIVALCLLIRCLLKLKK